MLFVQALSSLGDVERYWAAVSEILRRAREKSPIPHRAIFTQFSPSLCRQGLVEGYRAHYRLTARPAW